MNTDLRQYRSTILEAVKQERERDENWSWRVIAINKNEIKIGWGYLDFLHEKTPFSVIIREDEDIDDEGNTIQGNPNICEVLGYMGNNDIHDDLFFWVGPKHWHDAPTVEEALKKVIHAIASRAHNTF